MTDNSKRPVDTPAEWFRYADENWQVAEREYRYHEPACHTICFLCQSAAEKYLKGYLIAQGWMLEKTHDIIRLLELCTEYNPIFIELVPQGAVLNEYITEGRYPGDIAYEEIGREDAEEALEIVRRIRERVVEKKKPSNNEEHVSVTEEDSNV